MPPSPTHAPLFFAGCRKLFGPPKERLCRPHPAWNFCPCHPKPGSRERPGIPAPAPRGACAKVLLVNPFLPRPASTPSLPFYARMPFVVGALQAACATSPAHTRSRAAAFLTVDPNCLALQTTAIAYHVYPANRSDALIFFVPPSYPRHVTVHAPRSAAEYGCQPLAQGLVHLAHSGWHRHRTCAPSESTLVTPFHLTGRQAESFREWGSAVDLGHRRAVNAPPGAAG